MSRANIKPLVHWAIAKGYTLRFGERTPERVTGALTTPAGERAFSYETAVRLITLDAISSSQPAATIAINEYGWEENAP